jgi:flagella basal body P-ring formation protein FlgA
MRCIVSCQLALSLIGIGLGSMAGADSVTLKNAVRLPVGARIVTIGDIAEIEGPEAQRFADLAILTLNGTATAMEISIQDVRARLSDAGVHWGRLSLSGRSVTVRPARLGDAEPPVAMSAVAINTPRERQRDGSDAKPTCAAELVSQPTLRGDIARLLVTSIHARPDDIQFIFDAADDETLDVNTTAATETRYEIQPLGAASGDRIPVAIRTWTNDRAGERQTVTVQPRVRMKAAVLARDVGRDDVLRADDVESRELWLPPSQASHLISPVQAAGGIIAKSMTAGDVLRDASLRRNTLVKRGDTVMVRCLVGGAVISLQAEARADGAEGETIEFRKSGERESFNAIVTGRSEAVIDFSKK